MANYGKQGLVKEVFFHVNDMAEVNAYVIFINGKKITLTGRLDLVNDVELFEPYFPPRKRKNITIIPLKLHFKFIKTATNEEVKNRYNKSIDELLDKFDDKESVKGKNLRIHGVEEIEIFTSTRHPRGHIKNEELNLGGPAENIEILEAKNVPGLKDVNGN